MSNDDFCRSQVKQRNGVGGTGARACKTGARYLDFPQLWWDCARTVQESNVFMALGLGLSGNRFPELLKTLEAKREEGAIRKDSHALQAGGRGFESRHVHQPTHLLN